MGILPTFDFTPSGPPELKNFALMLRKLYEQLARFINNTNFVTSDFNDAVVPVGVKNGVNKVFTLPTVPNPKGSLMLFLDGLLQTQGTDYTLSGTTITYTTAPMVADTHIAWYRS